jgi:hypothetical protein
LLLTAIHKTDEFDAIWKTIKKPRNKRELKPPHKEGGLGSKEGDSLRADFGKECPVPPIQRAISPVRFFVAA